MPPVPEDLIRKHPSRHHSTKNLCTRNSENIKKIGSNISQNAADGAPSRNLTFHSKKKSANYSPSLVISNRHISPSIFSDSVCSIGFTMVFPRFPWDFARWPGKILHQNHRQLRIRARLDHPHVHGGQLHVELKAAAVHQQRLRATLGIRENLV